MDYEEYNKTYFEILKGFIHSDRFLRQSIQMNISGNCVAVLR